MTTSFPLTKVADRYPSVSATRDLPNCLFLSRYPVRAAETFGFRGTDTAGSKKRKQFRGYRRSGTEVPTGRGVGGYTRLRGRPLSKILLMGLYGFFIYQPSCSGLLPLYSRYPLSVGTSVPIVGNRQKTWAFADTDRFLVYPCRYRRTRAFLRLVPGIDTFCRIKKICTSARREAFRISMCLCGTLRCASIAAVWRRRAHPIPDVFYTRPLDCGRSRALSPPGGILPLQYGARHTNLTFSSPHTSYEWSQQ
jgi:hypothetical protein